MSSCIQDSPGYSRIILFPSQDAKLNHICKSPPLFFCFLSLGDICRFQGVGCGWQYLVQIGLNTVLSLSCSPSRCSEKGLFIYSWLHWVFAAVLMLGLSLVVVSSEYSRVGVYRLLTAVDSLVAEHSI